MPETIVATKHPFLSGEADLIRTCVASPGYSLLKEILVAHCVAHQVQAMNAQPYTLVTDSAKIVEDDARRKAAIHEACISALDDIEANPNEWYHLTLDYRRVNPATTVLDPTVSQQDQPPPLS